jgi:hypothetical protein
MVSSEKEKPEDKSIKERIKEEERRPCSSCTSQI